MIRTIMILSALLAIHSLSCNPEHRCMMNVVYPSINTKSEIPKGAFLMKEGVSGRFRIMRVIEVVLVQPCEFAGVELGYLPTSGLHDGQAVRPRISGLCVLGILARREYSSFDAACESLPLRDVDFDEEATCWQVPQQDTGALRMVASRGK